VELFLTTRCDGQRSHCYQQIFLHV